MSITGSYNTLLGHGAILPNTAQSNQIAVGSAAATTYIGGPNSLVCSSTGLFMDPAAALTVCGPAAVYGKLTAGAIQMKGELQTGGAGSPGAAGTFLVSAGAGALAGYTSTFTALGGSTPTTPRRSRGSRSALARRPP